MHLRSSLSNIRRSPFQAIAAILVLSVTFFVGTIIAILIYSSAQVLNYFETRPQVIVFLKSDTKQAEVDMLQLKLIERQKSGEIRDVKYVSKEEALSIYKEATSDNPLLGQLVSPSIFPASIEFSVVDINNAPKIIDEVKKEEVVDSVGFTASLGDEEKVKDVIGRLSNATFYIRLGGLVLGIVLAGTSFLVLMVIIGMRIATKKNEIETLKMMGATSAFIKTPIILEALIYVFLGVVLGWLLALIFLLYITPTVVTFFDQIPVLPEDTGSFLQLNFLILGVELAIGFVIAVLGSWVAATKATK